MSIEHLLNVFALSTVHSFGLLEAIVSFCLPFFLCFFLGFTYRRTQRQSDFSLSFLHSLFVFSCVSSILTLIIGNNIARAFGLVGALSIVRFRNALKSPMDAVYIFWALGVGVASGTGLYLIATMIAVLGSVFLLALHYSRYGELKDVESLVKVEVSGIGVSQPVDACEKLFSQKTKRYRRINEVIFSEEKKSCYTYCVRLKKELNVGGLLGELEAISGVTRVCLLHMDSAFSLG